MEIDLSSVCSKSNREKGDRRNIGNREKGLTQRRQSTRGKRQNVKRRRPLDRCHRTRMVKKDANYQIEEEEKTRLTIPGSGASLNGVILLRPQAKKLRGVDIKGV